MKKPNDLWAAFTALHPEQKDAHYEVWRFGGSDPDALLLLTQRAIKTAMASCYPLYLKEHAPLPAEQDFNIILNTHGAAVCITQTLRVTVCPFCRVPAEHAFREGEGDRTLDF